MTVAAAQPGFTVRTTEEEGNRLLVALAGRIALDDADRLLAALESLPEDRRPASVGIDLAGISYLDSAGVLALWRWEQRLKEKGVPWSYLRVPDEVQRIMGLIDREGIGRPPLHAESRSGGILERVGGVSLGVYRDFDCLMTFLGDLLAALVHLAVHPREVRWDDVFFYMRRAGADGLPIVALISLLIGLIIAFMSSLQLKQFGANLYVAALVAVAIVRELGPIMTAILVAGRSASAFAAEIGTMRVNDEVDALATMGFDPIRFLAVPKLIATLLVLPLLTLYADLFGILGGMIVGIMGLDLTAHTFLNTSRQSITLFFLLSSLVKSLVFAFVIAWIGCQRGFQVQGGVEAVGEATTSAVVTSILLIVVVDSAFAVVLHYVN
ncbi:MAG: MlaE family lipid ABC transporter permease subunit [Deltaproteobacteria bacterium]|nr:MlaE family lipid ABC transporter permease subunit [Deltaproteobacteria bacterium]